MLKKPAALPSFLAGQFCAFLTANSGWPRQRRTDPALPPIAGRSQVLSAKPIDGTRQSGYHLLQHQTPLQQESLIDSMKPLASQIPQLANHHILVVGDVSLDEYLFGRATRLSREAPIPVLEWLRRETILGGAANPARNIVALGSHARYVGVVGNDAEGQQVREALAAAAIDTGGLVVSAERPTTRKTRILADESPRLPQQLARLDRLAREPLSANEQAAVLAAVEAQIGEVEAVLCSDYQLGLLSNPVIETIRKRCHERGILFTVDAQGNALAYHGADLFRCNDVEASATLGRTLRSEADFTQALPELRAQLQARALIVTRGPEGLSLLGDRQAYQHLSAQQTSEVYDTTGAGDTFIATATLALAAGLSLLQAAQLANSAAALVVRRLGNAVVSPAELSAQLASASNA